MLEIKTVDDLYRKYVTNLETLPKTAPDYTQFEVALPDGLSKANAMVEAKKLKEQLSEALAKQQPLPQDRGKLLHAMSERHKRKSLIESTISKLNKLILALQYQLPNDHGEAASADAGRAPEAAEGTLFLEGPASQLPEDFLARCNRLLQNLELRPIEIYLPQTNDLDIFVRSGIHTRPMAVGAEAHYAPLPVDLWFVVLGFVDDRSLAAVSAVCRAWHNLTRARPFMHRLIKRAENHRNPVRRSLLDRPPSLERLAPNFIDHLNAVQGPQLFAHPGLLQNFLAGQQRHNNGGNPAAQAGRGRPYSDYQDAEGNCKGFVML